MKVGILTFHNAHNFGAALQAFALKETIRQLGHDVEIVNYCNENIEKRYNSKLTVKIGKRDIINPKRLLLKIRELLELSYKQPAWEKQCEKFKGFIYTYLLEGQKEQVTIEKLEKSDYDALIVGSDQIWESWITAGLDKVYLLDFTFQGRRIAYAGSKAGTDMRQEEFDLLKTCLNKFDYISVREEALKQKLSREVNKRILCTLDPSLLLNKKDYLKILEEPDNLKEKYVFAYFVSESEQLMECAEYIAEIKGIELIELHYYMQKKLKEHNQIADIGPEEFLGYIKNADTVLTNSFHGTVFSILFHKNFYSVCEKNMRIESLLEMLQLEKRCIYDKSMIIGTDIDFERTDIWLHNKQKESIQFLKEALRENE